MTLIPTPIVAQVAKAIGRKRNLIGKGFPPADPHSLKMLKPMRLGGSMPRETGRFHASHISAPQTQRVLKYAVACHNSGGCTTMEAIRETGVTAISQAFSSLKEAGIYHDTFWDRNLETGAQRCRYRLRDLAKAKAAIIQ